MVLGSSESGGCARRGSPENPAARAALVLRKLLRLGKHSDGNMVVSVHRRAGADYWNEQADDTAERVIGQECWVVKAEHPMRRSTCGRSARSRPFGAPFPRGRSRRRSGYPG